MPISQDEAADFGLLALCAEDMYRDYDTKAKKLTPDIDPRVLTHWTPKAFIIANDTIFPKNFPLQLSSERLFYAFVAQGNTDPTQWVVAVRGTAGIVEWIIDARFLAVEHPRCPGAHVEQGFWDVYGSMSLTALDGTLLDDNAAAGLAALIQAGSVTVVGHSLGSALATYLSFDLAGLLGAKVGACLFASPRTGDQTWATVYDGRMQDRYAVFNYVLDVVPHLPTRPLYVTLPAAKLIQPSAALGGIAAQAGIKVDILSDHHVLCYAAMLSYPHALTPPLAPSDTDARRCIYGDATTIPEEANVLAEAITHLMGTDFHVSTLFKTMLAFDIV